MKAPVLRVFVCIIGLISALGGTAFAAEKVEKGKKSLAFSIAYRSPDRTLNDDEVNGVQERILTALGEKFGAMLRS